MSVVNLYPIRERAPRNYLPAMIVTSLAMWAALSAAIYWMVF